MNKLKLCILSAAAVFAGLTNASAQQPVQLTLNQALEVALSESNTIKIADITVEKSGYAKKGSYASLYPNISASGSYQRTLKKQVMVMIWAANLWKSRLVRTTTSTLALRPPCP